MVHGEPWDLQKNGSIVNWSCRGLQGGNTLSVTPFLILFSVVSSPENKTSPFMQPNCIYLTVSLYAKNPVSSFIPY